MAIKLNELEATGTRWQAPSDEYPQGAFINGTGQGKRDGSYAKAEWANDIFGAIGAVLKNGNETPNGQVETANESQFFNALKKIIKNDIDTLGGDPSAVASGTVNAITATFTKPVTLEGGKLVKVRALGANTSTTVTFNPNGLGAKPVVKGDNDALAVGDIAGAGYWITMIYDATLQKWVLQNPATGVTLVLPDASTSTKGIIQIATRAEVANGTDKTKAVTPFDLMQNFVSVAAQSLTDEQKTQIVQNLVGTFLPLAGGDVKGYLYVDGYRLRGYNEDGLKVLEIAGGASWENGATLRLYSNDDPDFPGAFSISTGDNVPLIGRTGGSLKLNSNPIPRLVKRVENYVTVATNQGTAFTITLDEPINPNEYVVSVMLWQGNGFATLGYAYGAKTSTNVTINLYAYNVPASDVKVETSIYRIS